MPKQPHCGFCGVQLEHDETYCPVCGTDLDQ